jgi:hypothetical protein
VTQKPEFQRPPRTPNTVPAIQRAGEEHVLSADENGALLRKKVPIIPRIRAPHELMHPDSSAPSCPSAPGPENANAIERVTYYDFRLLNQHAHRETPYESTGPGAILHVNTMPAPGSENAERFAHACGDSNEPVSRVGRGSKRALPLMRKRRRRTEAGKPRLKVLHASYPAFERRDATGRIGTRSACVWRPWYRRRVGIAANPTEIDR